MEFLSIRTFELLGSVEFSPIFLSMKNYRYFFSISYFLLFSVKKHGVPSTHVPVRTANDTSRLVRRACTVFLTVLCSNFLKSALISTSQHGYITRTVRYDTSIFSNFLTFFLILFENTKILQNILKN